jgi:hypothetical protein
VRISAESEGVAGATGEAINFSDGGACLALDDASFNVDDELILWLTFHGPQSRVPATGRVVWMAPTSGRPRYGLEWTHEGPQRDWIGWIVGVQ